MLTPSARRARRGLEVDVYGVPAYSTLAAARRVLRRSVAQHLHPAGPSSNWRGSSSTSSRTRSPTRPATPCSTSRSRCGRAHRRRTLDRRARVPKAEYAAPPSVGASSAADDAHDRWPAALREHGPLRRRQARRQGGADAALRDEYAALRRPRHGYTGYDAWMARANNASLAVLAAYTELVPRASSACSARAGGARHGEVLRGGEETRRDAEGRTPGRARSTLNPANEHRRRPHHGRHPHSPRAQARAGAGTQDRLAVGRGGRAALRHGVRRHRGRDERHRRVPACRRRRRADRRRRPLRPARPARPPARRVQQDDREGGARNLDALLAAQAKPAAQESSNNRQRRQPATSATRSGRRTPASRRRRSCP